MNDVTPPTLNRLAHRWFLEHFPNDRIGRGSDDSIHWPTQLAEFNTQLEIELMNL